MNNSTYQGQHRMGFLWALASLIASISCSDVDTQLARFSASECKSKRTSGTALSTLGADAGVSSAAITGAEYNGLNCFAWEQEPAGALRIEFYNLRDGCSVTWEGSAVRTDSKLELTAKNADCIVAACGSCEYDVAFELEPTATGEPLEPEPLAVELYVDDCQSRTLSAGASLPVHERSSGIVCREAAHISGYFGCGGAHLRPCRNELGGVATSCDEPGATCNQGLVCEPRADERLVCVATCSADSDCLAEVEHCEAGRCRLRETF
jgi:hypothetical protein